MNNIDAFNGGAQIGNAQNYTDISGVQVPLEYTDPISLEIMDNPVIVQPSGNTFDQSTIDDLSRREVTLKDPLTRGYITAVIPNRALKETIDRFVNEHQVLREEREQRVAPVQVVEVVGAQDVINYKSHEFCSLFSEKNIVEFPANQEIKIYGINLGLCHTALTQLQDNSPTNLFNMLDDLLMVNGKRLTKFKTPEGTLSVFSNLSSTSQETFVSFKSTAPIEIVTTRGPIITRVNSLLRRMCESEIDILNFDPDQQLALRMSAKHLAYIREAAGQNNQPLVCERLLSIFLIKKPEVIKKVLIEAGGGMNFTANVVDHPDCVMLSGVNGMRIQLWR